MPDLNYQQPEVLAEMKQVARFWLTEMGADGFRLDAVKFLVEEGGQVDDAPGTHRVLRDYASHVRRIRSDAFTIGEVFDSTGTLLAYYPDQLDGYFAFEVADSLVAGAREGRGKGVLAPVLRLQERLPAWRWSPFLRNHDQPRTRTELGGDWQAARVAAALLLTLPGLPFVYYGEELGMTGPKPDERIRTPMAWSLTGPHAGFTTGRPWQPLSEDSLEANVAAQDRDPGSLLTLYRRLIRLRADHPALAEGRLVPLVASHEAVAGFIRRHGRRAVLVVANLGRAPLASVTLDSDSLALPRGSYALRNALGGASGARLNVRDGRIHAFVPLPVLPPQTALVFDLSRL
jgi:glycosidase